VLPTGNNFSQVGSGMIGSLPAPLSRTDFMAMVKKTFHCGGIRYADAPVETVRKVAWCGGAGSFLIAAARRAGADAFITGDITYHKFFDNEDEMLLLDIGHYESEQFTSELIYDYLSKKFVNFAVRLSKLKTNPVQYY
jgi:putative NIF3 family GTP cyclohydrolase 1 type 2